MILISVCTHKQVELHFAKFIKLYRKNEVEWKKFLTDRGQGDPPIEFLIAIEEGFR